MNKIVLSGQELHKLAELDNYPIWVPDTFFVNEKMAHLHQQTVPNQFVRIMHTGEVLLSRRLGKD
jgi:hypothetical protein